MPLPIKRLVLFSSSDIKNPKDPSLFPSWISWVSFMLSTASAPSYCRRQADLPLGKERTTMKILLGVDFSHDSKAAVRFLSAIRFPVRSDLFLIHSLKGFKELESISHSADLEEGLRTMQKRKIAQAETSLRRLGERFLDPRLTCHYVVREGNPGEEILTVLEKEQINLAVLGTRGITGIQRFLLGSVSEWILHEAPCPVLVVRGQARGLGGQQTRGMRVIVAIDGSSDSQKAISFLTHLTFPSDSTMILFHVVEATDYTVVQDDYAILPLGVSGKRDLARVVQDIQQRLDHARMAILEKAQKKLRPRDVRVETISPGYAADEIVKAAIRFRADLIIMGSRGLTGMKRMFLGSVSNRVTRHAPCSVLVVRKLSPPEKLKV